MKKYIKSSSNDVPEVNETFEFEVLFTIDRDVPDKITASIRKSGDLHFISSDVIRNNDTGKMSRGEREISDDFYTFVGAIINTASSCGYVELDSKISPYSDSLYFTLCHESDFIRATVQFIFYLRVSDHDLPLHRSDANRRDAEARKSIADKQDSKQYNWTNSRYADKEYNEYDDTPFTVVEQYVTYEGQTLDHFEGIISDIRKKLEKLKKRYSPQDDIK